MLICIAKIVNQDGAKYRLIDPSTKAVLEKTGQELSELEIRNIVISNGKLQFTEGSEDKYPLVSSSGIANNIPIVLSTQGKNVKIANYEGKIVAIGEKDLLARMKNFANAEVRRNKIHIIHNTPVGEQKTSETNAMDAADRVKQAVTKSLNLLDIVLGSPDIQTDIQNFNAREHNRNFGVSDNVFKGSASLARTLMNRELSVKEDRNAYSFDIVKVEDRVELRKYIGDGYTGKVIIPSDVTHICTAVFKDAEALEIEMPDSVIYLGDYAFEYSKVKKVRLSSNVTTIPIGCFLMSDLESINLESITSIDNLAFCGCNIVEAKFTAPVIQIGFEAFKDCKSLETFEHAKTIKKVRHHAFENCINLTYFDFESVTTIEQYAFNNTGLTKATLNGEINYLQSSTFTGKIEEIELLEGFEKVAAGAVSNIDNKPITWKMPKSVKNIEKGAFTPQDTVMCYRKTISASQAILQEAQIVYLDDLDKSTIPNVIKKARMLDAAVDDILRDTLKRILDKDDFKVAYDIDESRLVREPIPDIILDFIGKDFRVGKYADDSDIENEAPKFKCILEHLSKVGAFDIMPFLTNTLKLKDTFRVSDLEYLYRDDVSAVIRIRYVDNKFTSIDSSFIVAKTYDTLRYICMDNRYTDIMCENEDVIDIGELLKVLRPGDTIGLNSVISGVRYPEISAKSDKKIEVNKNGIKRKIPLEMNIYQALRFSSVTLKLDKNTIVLMLPGNAKIIKCASLGKTVWQNEKEETYKSLQCTIESIEDIEGNTVFDYDSTYNGNNYGQLFKRFKMMNEIEYGQYIESYSHIYEAKQSMYKIAGDYAYKHNIANITDADVKFMRLLFQTSLFERRQQSWLEDGKGRTIVEDAQYEFQLADGSVLYQYRSIRKTAMNSKLMSGGDRKIYIFEFINSRKVCEGVFISTYDIVSLVSMCTDINKRSTEKKLEDDKVFVNPDHFDVAAMDDIIEVASMCKGTGLRASKLIAEFILGVFKPNGLFYICLKVKYGRKFRYIPIVQVGEMDVALGFVEESNKLGSNSKSIKYMSLASLGVLHEYSKRTLGINDYSRIDKEKYLGLLQARKYCIEGKSDIQEYNRLGIPEVLKRTMGYTKDVDKLYQITDTDATSVAESTEDSGSRQRSRATSKTNTSQMSLDEIEIDESELEMGLDIDSEIAAELSLDKAANIGEDAMDAIRVANIAQSGIGDDAFDINDDDFGDI